MTVVVDTNVVISAAFWPRSEDRRCFVLLARRKCRMAVTEVTEGWSRSATALVGQCQFQMKPLTGESENPEWAGAARPMCIS